MSLALSPCLSLSHHVSRSLAMTLALSPCLSDNVSARSLDVTRCLLISASHITHCEQPSQSSLAQSLTMITICIHSHHLYHLYSHHFYNELTLCFIWSVIWSPFLCHSVSVTQPLSLTLCHSASVTQSLSLSLCHSVSDTQPMSLSL